MFFKVLEYEFVTTLRDGNFRDEQSVTSYAENFLRHVNYCEKETVKGAPFNNGHLLLKNEADYLRKLINSAVRIPKQSEAVKPDSIAKIEKEKILKNRSKN